MNGGAFPCRAHSGDQVRDAAADVALVLLVLRNRIGYDDNNEWGIDVKLFWLIRTTLPKWRCPTPPRSTWRTQMKVGVGGAVR
jgi:hypothetical protein